MDVLESIAPVVIGGGVLWVGLAIGIGLVAERRGGNGLLWFALAVFLSPLIALILLLIITPRGGPTLRP